MNSSDDVVIVGGGVIGLSLAYELSDHVSRIHLIDRQVLGKEASWAGAGILPPANLDTAQHPLEQLRGLSHRLHPEWAERLRAETGIDTGFRRCGGIYLARRAGETALLAGMAGMFRDEGLAIERLTPEDLRKIEPGLSDGSGDGSIMAAYWLPDEAQLRNPHHLQALARACRARGVKFSQDTKVREFEIRDGRLQRIVTDRGTYTADRVCIASGAWTHLLLKNMKIPNGIIPIRGQMLLYRCPRRPFKAVLNEGPRYLVPRDDGHVLVGSSEEEEGFVKGTTDDVLAELRLLAESLVPSLRDAPVEASWSGLRPGSFDGFPYMGKIPNVENLFVAAGHFRSGLHMSPATAVVMSQLIRGQPPRIDLTPFRIGRG